MAAASAVGERQRLHTDVLDMVDAIGGASDLIGLYALLKLYLQAFDIDHFIISGLPLPDERLERVIVLRHWPEGWFEMYLRKGFLKVDPTVRMCRATTMPFEWNEAPVDPHEPRSRDVMNFARDFGLLRGFSLPIHGLQGSSACVSLGSRSPNLTSVTKPALHLLAMYAFERARRLIPALKTNQRRNPLTPREQEVLKWAAVGKSHADIADILCITERTVTAHSVNAAQKLGAANKTQAVVKAMQSQFIVI